MSGVSRRGLGWKRSNEIRRLGEPRAIILDAMQREHVWEQDPKSTRRITYISNQLRYVRGMRGWQEHGVGGRLSELLGLGLLGYVHGTVQEEDPLTKVYYTKPAPLWYLTEEGKAAPIDPEWDPQSKSASIKDEVAIEGFWK